MPQVEVTFDIDANGIVHVSAKDKATGKEQQIRIQASSGLSDGDIDRMVKEAEQFADTDKKRRDLAEARNQADSLVHSTEKNLKEYGDKIAAGEREAIETAIASVREVMDGEDVEAIKSRTEALAQASMKLGEAIYKASQEAPAQDSDGQGGAAAGEDHSTSHQSGSDDSTVVDAEFEEVDPNKDTKK